MNKTAIKNFAIWARNKLIADIKYKAGLMGITEKGIAGALPQSAGGTEFYDIGTSEPYCISGKEIEQRRRLKEVIENKAADTDYSTAYKYVIEEVAYTWFNRLIAVRFMEVNDYLPGHIRVLSSETGKMEPDLVTTPFDSELEFASTEEERIIQLKQDNKIDELFRMLFIKQCNALNELLPALFEKTNDYTEILLNFSVIDQEGVVYRLVHDIPEEDFDVNRGGQVEIIGWLYQYYNTEPKNDAFAKKGKITKEEIPAVTQLFTPDWIVRYMVENSLGRLWLEGHPDDTLKAKWKYYLDEAEQEPEVKKRLDEIKEEYKKLNPEDIRLIDPCMGSGHILVYAFDVLMQIYESAGWSQRDAAKSIVENNIYGLDIDDRAFQMAYFAVIMKARQYNRRILNSDIKCHVYSIQESNYINKKQLRFFGASLTEHKKREAIKQIQEIIEIFKDAKEYGSILNVPKYDWELLHEFVFKTDENVQISLESVGLDKTKEQVTEIIEIAEIIASNFHVVITNPPYMSSAGMTVKLSEFVKKHYPNSKADLFAVLIEKTQYMTREMGLQAMITQHAWMFISSFEGLRANMTNKQLVNMIHLGPRAFEEISGEVVQTTAFVRKNCNVPNYSGTYCRLVEAKSQKEKELLFLSGTERYCVSLDRFRSIPEGPYSYWLSDKLISHYSDGTKLLGDIAAPCAGLATGDNTRFQRLWFEVDYTNIGFDVSSTDETKNRCEKWYPCHSGGIFRKWYADDWAVVNWKNDGVEIKQFRNSAGKLAARPQNTKRYFYEGLTWNKLSTSRFAAKYKPKGYIFDDTSRSAFLNDSNDILYYLGLLCSKVTMKYLEALNPTMSFTNGDLVRIPCVYDEKRKTTISRLVERNIQITKADWDAYEVSWRYASSPLVIKNENLISTCYEKWELSCNQRFEELLSNEELLNKLFAEIYGVSDELECQCDVKDIVVRKANLERDIKELISWAVGCMFGRFSLDENGITYAGGKWDNSKYATFIPDADGIIPITDEEYFEDDIVGLFCAWLKKVYGEETLEENLDFIAKALGKKGNSSREIIRNYFLTDFYKDHCSTYSVTGSGKRPIYWLFDSGKQNGFKALIYLHRYTPDTIGNLRVDYLHRMQRVYESEMNRMQDMIEHSTNSREVAAASKRKEKLQKQLKECREYDEKIGHLALDRIELDLDDGVKYNYRKIQTGRDGKFYEVLADSKSIMMDAKKYADFKK